MENIEQKNALQTAMRLFARVNRMHRCVFDRLVSGFGMHRSQHHMLMDLARAPESISQKELAERTGVTAAAVTGTLQKLEDCGMIERTISASDNRYREIKLTEKGKETAEMTHRWFIGADKAMFRGFSEEELESFITAMEKLRDNLQAMESGEIEIRPLDPSELPAHLRKGERKA